MEVPVLGFAAYSGTGKTTLIERLLGRLTAAGLRVAVVKHDVHGLDLDRPGKDSHRFSDAGAVMSVVSAPDRTAVIEQRPLTFEAVLASVHDVDLILVEGFKREAITQIGVCRRASGGTFPDALQRYIALVTDLDGLETNLPVFAPDDIEGLAAFIMKNMDDFTHFNTQGRAKMVDVGEKPVTKRTAVAGAAVLVSPETLALVKSGGTKKGDVLTVAQVAGVMGAKQTASLIPMCHPVALSGIDLQLWLDEARCAVEIRASVSCDGHTGVEMEALTAVSTAALTVYDMCKAVQRDIEITEIRLLRKTGGVHGDFNREDV